VNDRRKNFSTIMPINSIKLLDREGPIGDKQLYAIHAHQMGLGFYLSRVHIMMEGAPTRAGGAQYDPLSTLSWKESQCQWLPGNMKKVILLSLPCICT
jgi:hypothetical protein